MARSSFTVTFVMACVIALAFGQGTLARAPDVPFRGNVGDATRGASARAGELQRSVPARSGQAKAPCDLLSTCRTPASCPVMSEEPPEEFTITFSTTVGAFDVAVNTKAAPPFATRAWRLAKLGYWDGASFFRTLIKPGQQFVAQFGYKGNASVDACWDAHMTSNASWAVPPPGNVKGSVSFAMGAVQHALPNCTSAEYCAQGFSTNIFVNLQDNNNLDAPGFVPFGTVVAPGMDVVERLYAGYGECTELCPTGASDPFCIGTGASCQGVSMTRLVKEGDAYLRAEKPKLTKITTATAVAAAR